MQVRRIVLVVCLLVGMAAGAAARVPHQTQRAGKMDDSILATILDALGITLDGKLSVPPG
jgi:hypothetical protein